MVTGVKASGDASPFRVDAHYYSGGLHVHAFSPLKGDVSWVPSPPEDFAGFRDEFTLAKGDYAVEFSRLFYKGRQITWIAVYHRSVDEKFGDRANHAGVGVWLLEHFAKQPALLLVALRGIADILATRGIDAISSDVKALQGAEYLPKYISEFREVVPSLSGWPFAAEKITETALFCAHDGESDGWRDVADHIIRMTVLPPPSRGTSRALMLVSQSAERLATVGSRFTRIRGGVGAEIVSALPMALESAGREHGEMRRRIQSAEEAAARLQAEADRERRKNAELSHRIADLEGQVAESDIRRRLFSIDQKLEGIARSGVGASQIDQVLHEIKRLQHTAPPAFSPSQIMPHFGSEVRQPRGRWLQPLLWFAAAAAFVGIVLALGIWWFSSGPDADSGDDPPVELFQNDSQSPAADPSPFGQERFPGESASNYSE